MILEHFGLREPPFRITPHTEFFFDGAGRGATLEALLYAILHDEGIVKVSGEIGSGKTMLCRVLAERLPPSVQTVYLATPSLAPEEILRELALELGLGLAESRPAPALRALQERLVELYAGNRRVVLLVDEAHAMPKQTLEQVRLLANLEASRRKLLQIVLFGQPELDQILADPALRPLNDRIAHAFRVRPLSRGEVGAYLSFRMRAAGYRGAGAFDARAVALIARASAGSTRRINILADRCLLAAYAADSHRVGAREARRAIADAPVGRSAPPHARRAVYTVVFIIGCAIGAMGYRARSPNADAVGSSQTPKLAQQATISAAGASAPAPAAAPPRPMLSAEQIGRLRGYSASGRALLQARIDATLEKLAREPDERIGVELFFTPRSDPARIERFLARNAGRMQIDEMLVIPISGGDGYRIRVIYGAFASRAQAIEAERLLPQRYRRAAGPLLRSFGELRRAI